MIFEDELNRDYINRWPFYNFELYRCHSGWMGLDSDVPLRLKKKLKAVLVSELLGLKSIDYALKKHVNKMLQSSPAPDSITLYRKRVFKSCHGSLLLLRDDLSVPREGDPLPGVAASELVLGRLVPTFLSCFFLLSQKFPFESAALIRAALEQTAWAYQVHQMDDFEKIFSCKPTKAISTLKKRYPMAGELYGHLSKMTHLDPSLHSSFIDEWNGKVIIHFARNVDDLVLILVDVLICYSEVVKIVRNSYDQGRHDKLGKASGNLVNIFNVFKMRLDDLRKGKAGAERRRRLNVLLRQQYSS